MKQKKFSLRRLLSVLLVTAILVTQVMVSSASIVNAETIPIDGSDSITVFEDNFNRTDRDINDDNGWISNYQSNSHKIVDNTLSVYDYSDQNGIAVCYTKRPNSEASLAQKVSVDINNADKFTYFSSANVHLRYVADAGSAGPAQNYYVAVTKQNIKIGKIFGDWSSSATKALDNGGEETFYVYNKNNEYRIEFIAEGSNPTTLTATLYDKTAGIAVATVSGTDSQTELQQAGTVALSTKRNGAGQDTAIFDNFRYEYIKTDSSEAPYQTMFEDTFDRADKVISATANNENGWTKGSRANASISNNVVLLNTTNKDSAFPAERGKDHIAATALVRPQTEATLNQIVSADFKINYDVNKVNMGGAVIARCQGDTVSDSNCYSAYVRMGLNGENNVAYDLVIRNTSSEIYRSYLSEQTSGLQSKVKHRLTLKAESISSTETKLTVSLYTIADDGTVTLKKEKTVVDSDPNLQRAGTTGFSLYEYWGFQISVDNFKYQYQPTFYDDFNRDNGDVLNGWTVGDSSRATAKIENGKVYLESTDKNYGDGMYSRSMTNISNEASLNSVVMAEFQTLNGATAAQQGGAVFARCQGTTVERENCYSAFLRLGFNNAGDWQTGLYLRNSQGIIHADTTNYAHASGIRYRLGLKTESISDTETEITIIFCVYDADGLLIRNRMIKVIDNDPVLQNKGTVGFSTYDNTGAKPRVDNFSYYSLSAVDAIDQNEVTFEKENNIYKTFESEAVETYRYNYKKTIGIDSASDNAAAIQNTHCSSVSFENLTDELVDTTGYIVYNITADSTANYPVKLRYKFGSANENDYNDYISSGNKVYAPIIVNGQKYKIETSGYGDFTTTDAYEIPLVKGNNTIYCFAPTTEIVSDIIGAYIDYDCLLVSGDVKVTAGNFVIRGDVNVDGELNIIDLVRMKKYIANSCSDIEKNIANFDETDFELNGSDLTRMRKYFLGDLTNSELKEMSWPKFVETNYPTEAEMLNNTYYKLNVSKKLNVAYLGGSVTVGQMASTTGEHADTYWRQLTFDWLCEQYPDATITQTNGAVGGTGSSYGLENVVEKLKLNSSTEKPDLIFIEYAINDYYNGENSASVKNNMEWIIRTIYTYAPDADIMIVLTGEYTNLNLDYETKVAHKWIAERFRLPCISVASMLWDDMVEENNGNVPNLNQWKKYFANYKLSANPSTFDWVHPNDAGYQKYAEYIINYMESIFDAKNGNVPANTVNSFIPVSIINDKQTPLPVKDGDYEILDNTFYKLTNEKRINVAYFGGSITYGTGATNPATDSWRALTTKWLEETYNAQVIENNAAFGGTGTAFGIYRAVEHLKLTSETEKPDLVFIDFAINDRYDGTDYATAKANMEAIVRTIYEYSPKAEIIILLTTDGQMNSSEYDQYRAHKEVAEKFNIPCIAIGKMLWVEEKGNYSNWIKHFLPDGVHPNNSGHAKYADYVISYLESTMNAKKFILADTVNIDISEVAMGDNVPENTWFETFKGQTAPAGMEIAGTGISTGYLKTSTGTETAQFTIKFTGTDLSFWAYKTTTSGNLTISIDGGEASTVSLYRSSDAPKIVPVVSGLEDTEHTVTVTLTPSEYGSYMQIHGCMIKSATNCDIVLAQ